MKENKKLLANNAMSEEELILNESSNYKVALLREDVTKRSKNTKHYKKHGGGYMAAVYGKNIHRLDDVSGEFSDIIGPIEEHNDHYIISSHLFKTFFPKKTGKRKYVFIEKEGIKIGFKYLRSNSSHRKNAEAEKTQSKFSNELNICSYPAFRYNNVEANVSLEYSVNESGIKENIILKKPHKSVFEFELMLEGANASISEDGKNISFYKENSKTKESVFSLPAPNMTDAAGVFSESVHYELNENVLSIVADNDWLNAEERLFPVAVDPSIVITDENENKFNSFISVSSDNESYENQSSHKVGCYDCIEHRLYIKANYPELPSNAKITRAALILSQRDYCGDSSFDVYRVGESWSSDITWNTQPEVLNTPIGSIPNQHRTVGEDIPIDITSAVKEYYEGTGAVNNGFMIKRRPYSSSGEGNNGSSSATECDCNQYISLYGEGSTNDPSIIIEYYITDEFADSQKHESFDAGRAGSGSVNLFAGNLIFTHSDVSASGGHLPLNISHIYRSDYKDVDMMGRGYGTGWTLSCAQVLENVSGTDDMPTYRDALGRLHYFAKKTVDSGDIYYDTAGLGLYLSTNGNTQTVIDAKGNIMTFKNKLLTEIKDANNNKITITYNNSNRISQVTDSLGRTATFTYVGSILTSITDHDGRITTYGYSGLNLKKITYPDNTYTEFSYVSHRLSSVTDRTGITYTIEYDSQNRVSSVSSSGKKTITNGAGSASTSVIGGGFELEYRAFSTAVKDKQTNVKTVHKFDGAGRISLSYEDLTENTSLPRGEMTLTDISEYATLRDNKTGDDTDGKYASLKTAITGTAQMHPNLLENASFASEAAGTAVPDGWVVSGHEYGGGCVTNEGFLEGYKSYKLTCGTSPWNNIRYVSQVVDLCSAELEGNVLIASAWVKAAAPYDIYGESGKSAPEFTLYGLIRYSDGSYTENSSVYDCGTTEWQYTAVPLEINEDKTPTQAILRFDFSNNNSYCLMSNPRLCQSRGTVNYIDYEADRTVNGLAEEKVTRIQMTNNGIQWRYVYYNDKSDAVVTVYHTKEAQLWYDYATYNDKHLPIKTKDFRGVITEYEYDSYGNVTSQKTYNEDDSDSYILQKNAYNSAGRLIRTHDERNDVISTRYGYDNLNGLMTRTIAPNGQNYEYAYNEDNDLITSITAVNETCPDCDEKNNFGYVSGVLTNVNNEYQSFNFDYDQLGRMSRVKAGTSPLLTRSYTEGENSTVTSSFANGYTTVVTSDSRGNPIRKTVNGSEVSTAEYDECGNIVSLIDKLKGVCYNYTYDEFGDVIKVEERKTSNNSLVGAQTVTYDDSRRHISRTDSRVSQTYEALYERTIGSVGNIFPDNAVRGVALTGKFTDTVDRDGLRRPSVRKLTLNSASSPLMTDTYGYLARTGGGTTNYISSLSNTVGNSTSSLSYKYNNNGNITEISENGALKYKYTYDSLNRLTREDNYDAGVSYTWTYGCSTRGNLECKTKYLRNSSDTEWVQTAQTNYSYNSAWKDALTSFGNETITYDAIGNPTTYRGKTLTWTNVRRLASFGNNTFLYGADGIRYKKNNITYTLDGNRILKETDGTKTLTYYYGTSGVIGFRYNGADYYYRKNLQGDVIAIYNTSGTKVASYVYNAWGEVLKVTNHTSANIGDINPFRYRSYYYDTETKLYYLETRYYDPEVGRFINADSIDYLDPETIGGLNLFAYCVNNPVMGYDPEGTINGERSWDFDSSLYDSSRNSYRPSLFRDRLLGIRGNNPSFEFSDKIYMNVIDYEVYLTEGVWKKGKFRIALSVASGKVFLTVNSNSLKKDGEVGINVGAKVSALVLSANYEIADVDVSAQVDFFTIGIQFSYTNEGFEFQIGLGLIGGGFSISWD